MDSDAHPTDHLAMAAAGALDAANRDRLDVHPVDCPPCRAELGSGASGG